MLKTCCKLAISHLVVTCQQVATNLSISSSYNKSVKIRLVASCHLQTCYNLLKQLAASLWITGFDNQLAISLVTTCIRLVINTLSQAMQTHPDIGLLITIVIPLQEFNRRIFGCVEALITTFTKCQTDPSVQMIYSFQMLHR